MKRGMGVPPVFEDTVFDADLDETTTAETEKGLHILQVLEERSGTTTNLLSSSCLAHSAASFTPFDAIAGNRRRCRH